MKHLIRRFQLWLKDITFNKIALILGYILIAISLIILNLMKQTYSEIEKKLNKLDVIEQEIEYEKNS